MKYTTTSSLLLHIIFIVYQIISTMSSQSSQQPVGIHYQIAYFNVTNLAEVTRLAFSATNTPFEDYRYPISFVDGAAVKPEFDAIKHTLPFGQIPV